jgi:hypothetical protein
MTSLSFGYRLTGALPMKRNSVINKLCYVGYRDKKKEKGMFTPLHVTSNYIIRINKSRYSKCRNCLKPLSGAITKLPVVLAASLANSKQFYNVICWNSLLLPQFFVEKIKIERKW